MTNNHDAIFEAHFNQLADRAQAFTPGQKLQLAQYLLEQALQEGRLPIAAGREIKIPVNDPRIQAIQSGREVSLAGTMVQGGPARGLSKRNGLLMIGAVVILMVLGGWAFLSKPEATAEASAEISPTPTLAAATATASPQPAGNPEATPYALVLDAGEIPTGSDEPVSIEFGGQAFVLRLSEVDDGAWRPAVAEWLQGTTLRRVVAVPFSFQVGEAVARLAANDPILLRLGSGEVVEYRLVDIQRVQRHQIEILNLRTPSLAVILHGERASERWVLIGAAVQEGKLAPNQATAQTWTFIPPQPVTQIVTSTLTLENQAAGLAISVTGCVRVAQIGASSGRFMVCDVRLTALRDNVSYSGETLAITEISQILQNPGWWPPALAVVGGVGDGLLLHAGDSVTGKVAGAVAKDVQSNAVLLWEQAGVRYVLEAIEQ